MDTEFNPYAAPEAQLVPAHAEAVRKRYEFLRTEAHLKACGLLIMAGSLVAVIGSCIVVARVGEVYQSMQTRDSRIPAYSLPAYPWRLMLGWGLFFVTGAGLYALKRWAAWLTNIVVTLFVLVDLMELPGSLVELLVTAVLLRFLLSKESRHIFSRDYQRMIRQTPEIKIAPATWIYPLIVLHVMLTAARLWRWG